MRVIAACLWLENKFKRIVISVPWKLLGIYHLSAVGENLWKPFLCFLLRHHCHSIHVLLVSTVSWTPSYGLTASIQAHPDTDPLHSFPQYCDHHHHHHCDMISLSIVMWSHTVSLLLTIAPFLLAPTLERWSNKGQAKPGISFWLPDSWRTRMSLLSFISNIFKQRMSEMEVCWTGRLKISSTWGIDPDTEVKVGDSLVMLGAFSTEHD